MADNEQIYKFRYSLSEQCLQRFRNKYFAHRSLKNTISEMGLPGFEGQRQSQAKLKKTKYFIIPILSSSNTITMFVFRKVIFMAGKLYFICFTSYNLHKFKMAANMLKTNYYNFNVHTKLHWVSILTCSITVWFWSISGFIPSCP